MTVSRANICFISNTVIYLLIAPFCFVCRCSLCNWCAEGFGRTSTVATGSQHRRLSLSAFKSGAHRNRCSWNNQIILQQWLSDTAHQQWQWIVAGHVRFPKNVFGEQAENRLFENRLQRCTSAYTKAHQRNLLERCDCRNRIPNGSKVAAFDAGVSQWGERRNELGAV